MEVKRGDIWFVDLPDFVECVQYGLRPCIVCSNNKANFYSPVITIVPVSRANKRKLETHVKVEHNGLDANSTALCEQILTINKKNLYRYVGSCSAEKMLEIDIALNIQLQKADFKKQDNDIEIYQAALRQAKAIEFLEEFILNHGESSEIMSSLYIQIQELQSYCKIHNIDITKIYQTKLKAPSRKTKVG